MADDKPDAGWTIMDRTLELLAVHCATVAYQEASGWECAGCGEYIDSRNITGWLARAEQMRTGRRLASEPLQVTLDNRSATFTPSTPMTPYFAGEEGMPND
jgi:hypothetical protein